MVCVNQLRAGVAGTRGLGRGIEWSAAEWERVWSVLSPREQDVVYHHVVEGLTHTEVAEALGVKRGAVDGAWRRALERIRAVLPSLN